MLLHINTRRAEFVAGVIAITLLIEKIEQCNEARASLDVH